MRIAVVDPIPPFMGIPSGLAAPYLMLSAAEKKVLLEAVAILEAAHDLVNDRDPDHQDGGELCDALCLAPTAIRSFVADGFEVAP